MVSEILKAARLFPARHRCADAIDEVMVRMAAFERRHEQHRVGGFHKTLYRQVDCLKVLHDFPAVKRNLPYVCHSEKPYSPPCFISAHRAI